MPVENITESMHDVDEKATWLSIYYNSDFYRVRVQTNKDGSLGFAVHDYDNNLIHDDETTALMIEEAKKWISQTNG